MAFVVQLDLSLKFKVAPHPAKSRVLNSVAQEQGPDFQQHMHMFLESVEKEGFSGESNDVGHPLPS